ncbi:MAG: hypothetical protein AB7G75_30900 [Candidatus Binatia bacterium]
MKTKGAEQGVLVPKRFLKGIKEVEIRKDDSVILVVPVIEDPILALGSQPITDEITDASEHHDAYLYSQGLRVGPCR